MTKKNVIIVAPHPDDETLGCAGTLLKHKARGDAVHWLIMTRMSASQGFSPDSILKREREISDASLAYGFESVHRMDWETTRLDRYPMSEIISKLGQVFETAKPNIVYLPYAHDVHTDHRITFDAASACTKWFRYPSVKRVLAYETLSETDFSMRLGHGFQPNSFVDISDHLTGKLEILHIYSSELGEFPFPRSEESVVALARIRGAACGAKAAEAFYLLKETL